MALLGERAHIWTGLVWGYFRLVQTYEGHSGYRMPWSVLRLIPLEADVEYHNFHHAKNIGNYSSFMTIWDTIFDSNWEYYLYLDKEKQKE
jgi:sterol desaturase/sphingolipid hydroxylase (fatty acid hydroxylase superfamily)